MIDYLDSAGATDEGHYEVMDKVPWGEQDTVFRSKKYPGYILTYNEGLGTMGLVKEVENTKSSVKIKSDAPGAVPSGNAMPSAGSPVTPTESESVPDKVRKPLGVADPLPTGEMKPVKSEESSEARNIFMSDVINYLKEVLDQDTSVQALQDENSVFNITLEDEEGKIIYRFKDIDFDADSSGR